MDTCDVYRGGGVRVPGTLFVCATVPPTTSTDRGGGRQRFGGARPSGAGNRSSAAAAAAGDGQGSGRAVNASALLVAMYRLDRVQGLASLVAVLVSATGLLVCLVVYLLFPALRRPAAGRALVCLTACLLAGQVLYLAGALHGYGALGDRAHLCYWLAVGTHYVLLAGAFWLNVIAMDAARSASSDSQVTPKPRTSSSTHIVCSAHKDNLW